MVGVGGVCGGWFEWKGDEAGGGCMCFIILHNQLVQFLKVNAIRSYLDGGVVRDAHVHADVRGERVPVVCGKRRAMVGVWAGRGGTAYGGLS